MDFVACSHSLDEKEALEHWRFEDVDVVSLHDSLLGFLGFELGALLSESIDCIASYSSPLGSRSEDIQSVALVMEPS